jgi:hypothetical protein
MRGASSCLEIHYWLTSRLQMLMWEAVECLPISNVVIKILDDMAALKLIDKVDSGYWEVNLNGVTRRHFGHC